MELLKSDIQVDKAYLPDPTMDHLRYFNRALSFAHTNYHERLQKIAKLDPRTLTATRFFEEYVYCLLATTEEIYRKPQFIKALSHELTPYYNSFWNVQEFPKKEDMKEKLASFNLTETQLQSIHETAYTVNQGIKLFGWTKYQNNFLNCYSKLTVLPGLGLSGAKKLSSSTGGPYSANDISELHNLATGFGFNDAHEMCTALQKHHPMSVRVIGTILWYSAVTFNTI